LSDEISPIIIIERVSRESIKVSVGKKSAIFELPKGVTPRQAFLDAVVMADIYQHMEHGLQELMDNTVPPYKSREEAKRDFNTFGKQYRKLIQLGLNESHILTLSEMKAKEDRKRKRARQIKPAGGPRKTAHKR